MSDLGHSDKIDVDVAATLEEFVCCLYGLKNIRQVNDGRLHLFKKLYGPKTQKRPVRKDKIIRSMLPAPMQSSPGGKN